MKRALALYLPLWSVDLIARREQTCSPPGASVRPADPAPRRSSHASRVLVTGVVSQKQVVISCCAASYADGVRPNMALADARALLSVGRVVVHTHNPDRDLAALRKLAQWTLRFAPLVAVDPPDGLLLDISGCERLFRSENRLLQRLQASLARRGVHSRAAIAPTFACARAVARFASDALTIVPPARVREALDPLPVAALDLPPDVVESLDEVGVTTIAHLLRLPRSALPARFGEQILLRLDHALGRAVEIIDPVQPNVPLVFERLFDGPTTQLDAVELAAHQLLAELTAALAQRESGVLRLMLLLERPGAEPIRLLLTLGRPSRHLKHLWALLRPRLHAANLGFGVERLELTALRTARLRHHQSACWTTPDHSRAQSDAAFWELADTLIARLGPDAVVQPGARSTHLPERVFRWRSVLEGPPSSGAAAAKSRKSGGARLEETPPLVLHRPSLLLEKPEPIDVIALTPDGPVSRLTHLGVTHAVLHCAGPERLSPEWWRQGTRDPDAPAASEAARDYFRVHTDSSRALWIYKELETARWYLHGEWT